MAKSYKTSVFNFARHREIDHYGLITATTGVVSPAEGEALEKLRQSCARDGAGRAGNRHPPTQWFMPCHSSRPGRGCRIRLKPMSGRWPPKPPPPIPAGVTHTIDALIARNAAIHDQECFNLNPAANVMNPRAEAALARGLGSRPSLGYPTAKYEMGLEAAERIEDHHGQPGGRDFRRSLRRDPGQFRCHGQSIRLHGADRAGR